MKDAFLSYSHEDRHYVQELGALLKNLGISCFVDRESITPGDEWLPCLRDAVATASTFILLWSARTAASEWCRREIGWAVDFSRKIISIRLDPTPLPDAIAKFQAVDLFDPTRLDPVEIAHKPISSFVGRHAELAQIAMHLRSSSPQRAAIIGLRGIGGIGKTELALSFASQYAKQFPGGTLMANLGTNRDAGDRGATLSSEEVVRRTLMDWSGRLGQMVSADVSLEFLIGNVSRLIAGRATTLGPVLLILDNVDDAWVVDVFCDHFSKAFQLITTRQEEIVERRDAAIIGLEGLQAEDARVLLAMYAPHLDASSSEQLLKALDYHPLGIQLCAKMMAAAPASTIQALIREIVSSVHAPQGAKSFAMPHVPRSLAECFAQSVARVRDSQCLALLWSMGSMAPAPWSVEALDAVSGGLNPAKTKANLDKLCSLGLIERADEGRWRTHRLLLDYLREISNRNALSQMLSEIGLPIAPWLFLRFGISLPAGSANYDARHDRYYKDFANAHKEENGALFAEIDNILLSLYRSLQNGDRDMARRCAHEWRRFLAGADLSACDLSRLDLSEANLERAKLRNAKLGTIPLPTTLVEALQWREMSKGWVARFAISSLITVSWAIWVARFTASDLWMQVPIALLLALAIALMLPFAQRSLELREAWTRRPWREWSSGLLLSAWYSFFVYQVLLISMIDAAGWQVFARNPIGGLVALVETALWGCLGMSMVVGAVALVGIGLSYPLRYIHAGQALSLLLTRTIQAAIVCVFGILGTRMMQYVPGLERYPSPMDVGGVLREWLMVGFGIGAVESIIGRRLRRIVAWNGDVNCRSSRITYGAVVAFGVQLAVFLAAMAFAAVSHDVEPVVVLYLPSAVFFQTLPLVLTIGLLDEARINRGLSVNHVTYLRSIQAEGADLCLANLRHVVLDAASLNGASLERADLEGASLRDANLECAVLTGAKLDRADLTGARLAGAILDGASLVGARLGGAVLRGASLRQTDLRDCEITYTKISNFEGNHGFEEQSDGRVIAAVDARDAIFDDARLEGARFVAVDLRNAKLRRANLSGAILDDANLDGADLSGADLRNASVERVLFQDVTCDDRTTWPSGFR